MVIGLTGGYAAGKSSIAEIFAEMGACTIDADGLSHEALRRESPVFDKIGALIPEAREDKALNRDKIAAVIFRDDKKRKELEGLIHPYVFERIAEEIGQTDASVIVLEIPLLFETGFHLHCHHSVVVKTDEEAVLTRLKKRGISRGEFRRRSKVQMSLEEKLKRTDKVVNNSGTLEETRRQVEEIWKDLKLSPKGAA